MRYIHKRKYKKRRYIFRKAINKYTERYIYREKHLQQTHIKRHIYIYKGRGSNSTTRSNKLKKIICLKFLL